MCDSAGEGAVFNRRELPGLVHHGDEFFAAGKLAGGFVEVFVVGGLAAEEAAEAWEDVV